METTQLRRSQRRVSAGFTLIEMLVVIAIISILMAMLLPALSRAREAGKRLQCANNMREIARAVHAYQAEYGGLFPPSVNFPSVSANDPGNYQAQKLKYNRDGTMYSKTDFCHNWVISILPHFNQNALYQEYIFRSVVSGAQFADRTLLYNESYTDAAGKTISKNNYVVLGTQLGFFICPSDNPGAEPFEIPGGDVNLKMARGNYAANAANGPFSLDMSWGPNTQGVMDVNRSLLDTQVQDGLTQTMMLGEVKIGIHKYDQRGTWALGTPGASSLWGHGVGVAYQPNPTVEDAECIMWGPSVISAVTAQRLTDVSMTLVNRSSNEYSVVRSAHPGGANLAMCDGAVIFVTDSIDSRPNFPTDGTRPATYEDSMGLWQRMIGSNDGLNADMSDLVN